jgi:CubicO group peptidase (beta-lactamase class C family)
MISADQNDQPTIMGDRFAQVCAVAAREMERLKVPGVAIGVLYGGQEYTAGLGVTSVDNPLPVTADTLFQIGSITKTITATVAMRLAERGQLDLDAPVRTYLPGLRLLDQGVAERVTLRHLFAHLGGWVGDYFDDTGNGDDALGLIVERMAELPQLAPLGSVYSYNNAGFYLAGRVIEAATDRAYEAAAKELVLDPLGMTMTFFFPADVMTYRFVAGHESPFAEGEPGPRVARPWQLARTASPIGGIISTARDQLRYARFHLGDGSAPSGERLLSRESLELMRKPHAPAANGEFVGVAWFLYDAAGVRLARHGGATKGQQAVLVTAPERGFAISVLTNSNRGGELHQQVVRAALEAYLGVREPEQVFLEPAAGQLDGYVGRYQAALATCELSLGDRELVLQYIPRGGFPTRGAPPGPTPPAVRVALCGEDQIVALDEPFKGTRGEFLRDAAGQIAWLRFGGRIHARNKK